ncbi:hypothetical protein NE237_019954 [Protea cynaroides]|uniref:Oleosin n=1 Tax=Protea cynaroides TaxID=273540 RepID=A0A9Q0H6C4_9MAGN|nr:hypothetical protein NE237_019954 [Protea cynaroides]
MADRQAQRPSARAAATPGGDGTFMRKLQDHAPNSTQLMGFLVLVISGGILLFLTGLTLTAIVLGLIFFLPLILLTSPIWVPAGTLLFIGVVVFLMTCGFGMAVVAGSLWIYRYLRGWHPPGSQRIDYARSRLANTANHVRDYAREYGGYLHSRSKDAAPGA